MQCREDGMHGGGVPGSAPQGREENEVGSGKLLPCFLWLHIPLLSSRVLVRQLPRERKEGRDGTQWVRQEDFHSLFIFYYLMNFITFIGVQQSSGQDDF